MSSAYTLETYGVGFEAASSATVVNSLVFRAPAAGTDWILTVPAGVLWIPVSLSVSWNASAAISTRTPTFQMAYNGATFYVVGAPMQLGANTATTFTLAVNIGQSQSLDQDSRQQLPLPVVVLPPGATISSSTVNLQAGDAWSTQSLYVRTAIMHGPDTSAYQPAEPLIPTPIAF